MENNLKKHKPTFLPTRFYVWLRKNHTTIVRLVSEGWSHAQVCLETEWTVNKDVAYALDLFDRHFLQIAANNWTGVEQELFGIYPYYEKLPSVQRALAELKDSRCSGRPPAARVRNRRSKKSESRVGEPGLTPSAAPIPTPIPAPILAPVAPPASNPGTPPAPAQKPAHPGPIVIPKATQIRHFEEATKKGHS
jgi:hypothetical protein